MLLTRWWTTRTTRRERSGSYRRLSNILGDNQQYLASDLLLCNLPSLTNRSVFVKYNDIHMLW